MRRVEITVEVEPEDASEDLRETYHAFVEALREAGLEGRFVVTGVTNLEEDE